MTLRPAEQQALEAILARDDLPWTWESDPSDPPIQRYIARVGVTFALVLRDAAQADAKGEEYSNLTLEVWDRGILLAQWDDDAHPELSSYFDKVLEGRAFPVRKWKNPLLDLAELLEGPAGKKDQP